MEGGRDRLLEFGESVRKVLFEFLKKNKGKMFTCREIAEACGLEKYYSRVGYIVRHLHILHERGLVKRKWMGQWFWWYDDSGKNREDE